MSLSLSLTPVFTCMFACCALSNPDGDEGNGNKLSAVFHLKNFPSEGFLFVFSLSVLLLFLSGLQSLAFWLFLRLFLFSSPVSVPWAENHRDQTFTVTFKARSDSLVGWPCLTPELPLNNNTPHYTTLCEAEKSSFSFSSPDFPPHKFYFPEVSVWQQLPVCFLALWRSSVIGWLTLWLSIASRLNADTLAHTDSCKHRLRGGDDDRRSSV